MRKNFAFLNNFFGRGLFDIYIGIMVLALVIFILIFRQDKPKHQHINYLPLLLLSDYVY
jgi:hypothetical protein